MKIIIIIVVSRYQHGYPWLSLAIPPNRPLLPVILHGYILYRHRAAICRFEQVVLPLLVHVKESTGVHHLWAHPPFFLSKAMGSSMVDIKASGWTLWRLNAMRNPVLGVWILRFNGQDRLIRSEKYCCSSIRLDSVDEN